MREGSAAGAAARCHARARRARGAASPRTQASRAVLPDAVFAPWQ
jgi:hypothetical protein